MTMLAAEVLGPYQMAPLMNLMTGGYILLALEAPVAVERIKEQMEPKNSNAKNTKTNLNNKCTQHTHEHT